MNAYFLAILTALLWGVVPLLEKTGLEGISPVTGLAVRSMGVLAGLFLMAVFFPPWKEVARLNGKTIILLTSGGFIASFVAQLIFYNALKAGQVSRVVPISACYPLVAFVLGVIFLGEKFTLIKFIGVSLIISGAILLR